jgi:hypothetical protein
MTEFRAGRSRRSRSSSTTSAMGSPGMPTSDDDIRMAELENRLARLEGDPGIRERGQLLVRKVMPAEAGRHFRNAAREQLLGFRSIIDFWIARVDDLDHKGGNDGDRTTIEVE